MVELLNLGAGVQSTTLLLMSCLGELPKLDHVLFADTQWEPAAVYEHLAWLEEYVADYGIKIIKVSAGNILEDTKQEFRVRLPLYTLDNKTKEKGMMQRECTRVYKIDVIRNWIREHVLCLKPKQPGPREEFVRQWFGISSDEVQRVHKPRESWSVSYFPLLGLETHKKKRQTRCEPALWLNRSACLHWLKQHGFKAPQKSGCIGCPFHSPESWRLMKLKSPEDFQQAVELDELLRDKNERDMDVFLHSECKPLKDISTKKRKSHSFFDGCDSGHCFV